MAYYKSRPTVKASKSQQTRGEMLGSWQRPKGKLAMEKRALDSHSYWNHVAKHSDASLFFKIIFSVCIEGIQFDILEDTQQEDCHGKVHEHICWRTHLPFLLCGKGLENLTSSAYIPNTACYVRLTVVFMWAVAPQIWVSGYKTAQVFNQVRPLNRFNPLSPPHNG